MVLLLLVDQVMVVPVLYATAEGEAEMLMVGANTLDAPCADTAPPPSLLPHADSTRLLNIIIDMFLHIFNLTIFIIIPSF